MKKSLLLIMAAMLALGTSAGAAYAKPQQREGQGKTAGTETRTESDSQASTNEGGSAIVVEPSVDGEASVTERTYGPDAQPEQGKPNKGHKGYRGLLNALEHVQDKPAGAVLADLLLTQYNVQLTEEMKARLQALATKQAALEETASVLDEQGSTEDAAVVQEEAVKAEPTNLDAYKKLGKLYKKLGKSGVKLYVNGEAPDFQVAPFLKNNVTLVPFRAIAEALDATVEWNPEERSVTVTRGDVTIKITVDSTTADVNGETVELEQPAEIVDGSTVVPARFLSESLDAQVDWEGESQSVVINQQ